MAISYLFLSLRELLLFLLLLLLRSIPFEGIKMSSIKRKARGDLESWNDVKVRT